MIHECITHPSYLELVKSCRVHALVLCAVPADSVVGLLHLIEADFVHMVALYE